MYTISRSNGATQNIADNVIDGSKFSIRLPGRGVFNYGQDYAETIVRMLENFASNDPPNRGIPGQIWFNSLSGILMINRGVADSNPVWSPVVFLGEEGNPLSAIYVTAIGSPTTRVNNLFVNNIGSSSARASNMYIENIGSTTSRVNTVYADTFNGTATSARYADLAERYESDKEYSPGTVVAFGGDKEITIANNAYDVFSVVSTTPGFLLNQEAGDNTTHPSIVLHGRSPVKVTGSIEKGDYIELSEIPGVAISSKFKSGKTFGRSLETNNSIGIKLVNCYIRAGV